MKSVFWLFCEELSESIKAAYESSVTIEEAEKLAAKFLHGQLQVAEQLRNADLDARMKKSGLKAVKAAVYMDGATRSEKKPSDVLLDHVINQDGSVNAAQDALDKAEVNRDHLQSYFSVFKEAHIFFRGVSKGRFE